MNGMEDDIRSREEGLRVEDKHNQLEPAGQGAVLEHHDPKDVKAEYRYAGFWMRFWAYLLDLLIIASLNGILVYPILRALDIKTSDPSMFAPVSILTAVIFYGYFVFMTKFFGQTLGKMVFGLKVISLGDQKLSWSTIMFREWIGRFISGSIFILYIVVAFLPRRQGIHDIFADTTVVHERS
ncbi:RDD family protein [Niallia endozanthoxylica]|uniref:RDD family protein n=2 Tax=Niallia endozanthoxylica TaxID=2036016 RepID=A0A5J5I1L6_9BACI|nr:RDD family protein [Niallia endozanthoxylica]